MADLFKRGLAVGLGLAQTSVEQAEKLVNQLVDKGEMTKAESKEFFDTYYKKGQDVQNKTWGNLNLASKDDVTRLEARLLLLEERMNELEEDQ